MTTERQSPKWSDLRRTLAKSESPELVDLIKELYDASPVNRSFLHARLAHQADDESVLKPFRERITHQFYPKRGFGKLQLAEARKAIRDYRKATGNLAGTAELMLTYVEFGTAFACEFGNHDARFYDSLSSVLGELVSLLARKGPELFPRFRERLLDLRDQAAFIGWGYGDEVADQVGTLEDDFDESMLEADD